MRFCQGLPLIRRLFFGGAQPLFLRKPARSDGLFDALVQLHQLRGRGFDRNLRRNGGGAFRVDVMLGELLRLTGRFIVGTLGFPGRGIESHLLFGEDARLAILLRAGFHGFACQGFGQHTGIGFLFGADFGVQALARRFL